MAQASTLLHKLCLSFLVCRLPYWHTSRLARHLPIVVIPPSNAAGQLCPSVTRVSCSKQLYNTVINLRGKAAAGSAPPPHLCLMYLHAQQHIGGKVGTKGSVMTSITIGPCSLLFCCAHLAAGQSISKIYTTPLSFKMACTQNLDLRCVLVPAPWVPVPTYVSIRPSL